MVRHIQEQGNHIVSLFRLLKELIVLQIHVQAVIVAPTRELATQLFDELAKITKGTEIRSTLLIGGTDKERSADRLKSNPHIVVGTPGRISYMVENGAL